MECNHKYVHLETAKWIDSSGTYNNGFFRIDRFFCEKCLDRKEVKKSEWCRETPEWFRGELGSK